MAKRKRDAGPQSETSPANAPPSPIKVVRTNGHTDVKTPPVVIQIVAGTYERLLHGITASVSDITSVDPTPSVQFANTFLFNAHSSAIRCLALSPLPDVESSETQGVYLASGGTDERVNVYSLSASPPVENDRLPSMPTLGNNKVLEDPRNRELGSLLQHSSSITALHFPTRAKLLSASEDNTIAISKTKDLTVISTVKAPNPKVQGQPSGDTAPVGASAAGVNDFAVHPSLKLMMSVGKGEKSMRLWNLVTGKKAGVLNFGREVLQSVKEGKYSSGEGRKIKWNPSGNEFAVAFERGAVVFGEDSTPKCKALPQPLTKLHQLSYVSISQASEKTHTLLALSTEDGRILFYSTVHTQNDTSPDPGPVLNAACRAQMGGKPAGVTGRIKDFEILQIKNEAGKPETMIIVTAGSDGTIKLWSIPINELLSSENTSKASEVHQIGDVIGNYETGSRITCLKAFVMHPARDESGFSEFEGLTEESEGVTSDSESDESE